MAVIKPSLPKGTRDFLPEQMLRRQFVMDKIRTIFEKYGYQPLETPSIEKLDVLSGKYGDEGEQLIFKVLKRGTGLEGLRKAAMSGARRAAKPGPAETERSESEFVVHRYGELVDEALRYDLTVPLSRVVAMYNRDLVYPFKRYQIQPVWRADRPQRGRYREFYQCDADTVGTKSMLADAETIAIVYDVLSTLGFRKFKIRINNRKILNGIMTYAGIDPERSTQVFVAIDKLEKIGLDGVKKELADREISNTEIDKILSVFEISGLVESGKDGLPSPAIDGKPETVLAELATSFKDIEEMQEGTKELQEIVGMLKTFDLPESFYQIDLFLVRGLGYYTGPIHESVVEEPRIGSLTGGGRYDKLIGMFLGRDIPAVGTAFGIERIIDVMTQLDMFPDMKTRTQVLVTIFDDATKDASLDLCRELRQADIRTESYMELTKLKKQFSYADKKQIPFIAIIGPDELAENRVTIKDLKSGEQFSVLRSDCIRELRKRLTV